MATVYTGTSSRVDVEYTYSQNVANNTTTITASAYLVKTANYNTWLGTGKTFTLNIGGNKKAISWVFKYSNMTLGRQYLITSHSATFTHTSAGSLTNPSITVYCATGTAGVGTVDGSLATSIPSIPRANIPTVTGRVDTGGNITIKTNSKVNAFRHTFEYTFGKLSGRISASTWIQTSVDWTVPEEFNWQLTNGVNGTGTITMHTHTGAGGAIIGSSTVNFYISIPSSVTPRLTTTITPQDDLSGKYVEGRSKAIIGINGAGYYGSSIRSTTTTVNGVLQGTGSTTQSTNLLTKSGWNDIVTTVTDSRGRSATSTNRIYVEPYTLPTISTFSVYRSDSNGTENQSGSYMRVVAKAQVSSVGGANTERQLRVRTRVSGGTWSAYTYGLPSYSPTLTHTPYASPNSSYEVEVYIGDYYGSDLRTDEIGTSFVLMDFHKDGKNMAIGKVAEAARGSLEVQGDVYLNNDVHVGGAVESTGRLNTSANLRVESYADIWGTLDVRGTSTLKRVNATSLYVGGSRVTGDEIESSGKNSNGYYVRFTDGTMHCYDYIYVTDVATTSANGSLYASNVVTWDYPADFTDRPSVTASDNITAQQVWAVPGTVGTSSYSFTFFATKSFPARGRYISVGATGRWK